MKYFVPYVYLKKKKVDQGDVKEYLVSILVLPEDNTVYRGVNVEHKVPIDTKKPKSEKITRVTMTFGLENGIVYPKPLEQNIIVDIDDIKTDSGKIDKIVVDVDHPDSHTIGYLTDHGGSSTVHYPDADDE